MGVPSVGHSCVPSTAQDKEHPGRHYQADRPQHHRRQPLTPTVWSTAAAEDPRSHRHRPSPRAPATPEPVHRQRSVPARPMPGSPAVADRIRSECAVVLVESPRRSQALEASHGATHHADDANDHAEVQPDHAAHNQEDKIPHVPHSRSVLSGRMAELPGNEGESRTGTNPCPHPLPGYTSGAYPAVGRGSRLGAFRGSTDQNNQFNHDERRNFNQ